MVGFLSTYVIKACSFHPYCKFLFKSVMFSLSTSVENKSTTNGKIGGQRELIYIVFTINFSKNKLVPILQLSDNCILGSSCMCCFVIQCNYGNFTWGFQVDFFYFKVIDGDFLVTIKGEEWLNSVTESNKAQPLVSIRCFPICRTFEN